MDQLDLPLLTPIHGLLPESGLELWEQIIREMLYKRPNYLIMTTALAHQLLTMLSRCRLQNGIKKDQQQELVETMYRMRSIKIIPMKYQWNKWHEK